MKRRVISFITVFILLLQLCPARALVMETVTLDETTAWTAPYTVSKQMKFDATQYTLTATKDTAMRVTGTGELILTGTVVSKKGAGVEVQTGGKLTTQEPVSISGTTYALDIAANATVQLAPGTYTGEIAAIRAADGAIVKPAEGYTFTDGYGNPISPDNLGSTTTITVKQCVNHVKGNCTAVSGSPTHTWTCPNCGTSGTDSCSFSFDGDGIGACSQCGRGLTIAVAPDDPSNLVYDGNLKPTNVEVTVTLTDDSNKQLVEDTDYKVEVEAIKDAGQATVTVTGLTFNGTFAKTYTVEKDTPVLSWDTSTKPVPVAVDYDGQPVEAGNLPSVKIDIKSDKDNLQGYLQYSYKTAGQDDSAYMSGLPKDAGTYDVIASLPELPNFEGAVSDPITLTITPINPIVTAPAAITLTYNRAPQALVTAGELDPVAAADGLEIQFVTDQAGPWSKDIPAGTNAGNYTVWYQVAGLTANYVTPNPNPEQVSDVKIQPKNITSTVRVELSETSYTYDGAKKNPQITLWDGAVEIEKNQYTVTWAGIDGLPDDDLLRIVGTYTATINNVTSGNNYTFTTTAKVEIIEADQNALHITGKPTHVYYGDVITTLNTTGGTEDGTVKWSVTPETTGVTIDASTGELTVKNVGKYTVKAEREVPNYGTVSDTWTFTVEPKPVTAVVTVAAKPYDGNTTATVTVAVKATDLVTVNSTTDTVTLSGLTGTFDTPDVGTGKTVTLDDTNATKADGSGKYIISYPATATGTINPRSVTVLVTLSDHDLQGNATSGYYYEYDGTEKKPNVIVEYGTPAVTIPASNYTVGYTNNKNVGTATVTVTAKVGGNYTFTAATVSFAIRNIAAVLTSSPQARDLTYIKGTQQELVTVGTATGGHLEYKLTSVPASEPTPTDFSTAIPKGTAAGTYTVEYKVVGDGNHGSTVPGQVSVTIKPKQITPAITLDPTSCVYDGSAKTPTVTVKDGTDTVDAGEYTVSYSNNTNVGTAMVTVSNANGGNYTVNSAVVTFQITKAAATVSTAPTGKNNLYYTGETQELLAARGTATGGTLVYSLSQDGEYSTAIPTGKAVREYEIWYKVLGDANHTDSAATALSPKVEITKNTVNNPTITLSSNTFKYNGNQQKPTVTVYDNSNRLIPQYEYTVSFAPNGSNTSDMVDVGTYTVTVAAATNSNYDFQGVTTTTFEIVPADQEIISITNNPARVHYGDVIQLGVAGGTGSGTVTWEVKDKDGNVASDFITATGRLTVKDVGGPFTVTVTRSRGGNYDDISATWEFTAEKKPVTAVVTAVDRNYIANDKTATVTASVPNSELVPGDNIIITGLIGTFEDANVGTDKKVTLSGGTVSGADAGKYDVTIPATTTASILPVLATCTAPGNVSPSLTYNAGQAQELVTAGTATGGTMVYSLDGTNFTPTIPKAKDAGTYTVYYKVRGDQNHTDSAVSSVDVTIDKQPVTPQIELSPPYAQYDGQVHQPAVTVRDKANNVIPASEYKVTYVTDSGANWRDQGTYTVKVEDIAGGNYIVAGKNETFTIKISAQAPLEIVNKPGLVYYGDSFTLSVTGGSASGAVTWKSDAESIAHVDANGLVTIKGTGSATITATKAGGGNYEEAKATYLLNALKKPVTAIVTADDKVYDGNTTATIHVTWNGLMWNDSIDTSALTGTFEDANVGTNKKVDIRGTQPTSDKYAITYPATATGSIRPKVLTMSAATAADRPYDGTNIVTITGVTLDGIVGSDNVTVDTNNLTGTIGGTDAGIYNTVALPALSLTGANAGNYMTLPGTVSTSVTISKTNADTLTPKTGNLMVANNQANTYTFGLDALLPDNVPANMRLGTVTYELAGTGVVNLNSSYSGSASISGQTLTLTITSVDSNHTGDIGNITVTIETGNFQNMTATINVSSTGKTIPTIPNDVPTLSATTLTYGQPLSTINLSGNMKATENGTEIEVPGTFAWSSPDHCPSAQTAYQAAWVFTPNENEKYATVCGTSTIEVKPAPITGAVVTLDQTSFRYDGQSHSPAVTAVTLKGVTLKEGTDYTVAVPDSPVTAAGTHTVTITGLGNYKDTATATFTIADKPVMEAAAVADGGKTEVQWSIPPDTYSGKGQVAVVSYDSSGQILGVSMTEIPELATGASGTAQLNTEAGGNCKLLLLDGDGYNPLIPAVEQGVSGP